MTGDIYKKKNPVNKHHQKQKILAQNTFNFLHPSFNFYTLPSAMDATGRVMFRRSTSGLTVLAHSFGILSLILLLFWLLHYRGGLNLESDISERIFNVSWFPCFLVNYFLKQKLHNKLNSSARTKPCFTFFCQVHPFMMFFGLIFLSGEGENLCNFSLRHFFLSKFKCFI